MWLFERLFLFVLFVISLITYLLGTVVTIALYAAVGYGLYLAAQYLGIIG